MKLHIHIQDTIVKDQDEYLAFFSILKTELERMGFVLDFLYDFHPQSYIDSDKMTDRTKTFSSLNISFAFRKMPKALSLPIGILPEGESSEFFNLYGELSPLYRTGVIGDGSCFYHSFLYSTDRVYASQSKGVKQKMVSELREEFSEWVTVGRYMNLMPLHTHMIIHTHIIHTLSGKASAEYNTMIPKEYPDNFIELYGNLTLDVKQEIDTSFDKWLGRTRDAIRDPTKWTEDEHIILFMEYKNVNVYIFSSTSRVPSRLFLQYYKPSRKDSILTLNLPNSHYESMFFGVKRKGQLYAKRVLGRMDPLLIKLHQYLIKTDIDQKGDDQKYGDQKGDDQKYGDQKGDDQSLENDPWSGLSLKNVQWSGLSKASKEMMESYLKNVVFRNTPITTKDIKQALDLDLISQLKMLRSLYPHKSSTFQLNPERAKKRALEIKRLLPEKYQPEVYLDFGGADGQITAEVGVALGATVSYCADLDSWENMHHNVSRDSRVQFLPIDQNENKIPLPDNSVDFCTALQVLHHLPNLNKSLSELYRVLKPGGYLIIREHDVTSEDERHRVNLIHYLYEVVTATKPNLDYFDHNPIYHSQLQWSNILTNIGFHVFRLKNAGSDDVNRVFHLVLQKPIFFLSKIDQESQESLSRATNKRKR
jgi:SAM-dependent methyltransferase